jgi:hypothetical protein
MAEPPLGVVVAPKRKRGTVAAAAAGFTVIVAVPAVDPARLDVTAKVTAVEEGTLAGGV